MKRAPVLVTGVLLALCGLSACQPTPPPAKPAAAASPAATGDASARRTAFQPQWADDALGIALLPVPGFELRRDFRGGYLGNDEWKAFAEAGSVGQPGVALVLQGSNEVTAAEMRIGSSQDARAVADCLKPTDNAESAQTHEVRIDGQAFQHFTAGDAAMSHYLNVDAYRAVRHDHCIAIDLLIIGTRPDVYDPPRPSPFDQDTAKAKLQEALQAVRIVR